jgi:OOP family OmpA-OmpF porin
MAARGTAYRPGGAISRLSPPLRYTLAAGLLAVGIGDLIALNLLLGPRYLAAAPVEVRPSTVLERKEVAGLHGASRVAEASAVPAKPAPSPSTPPPRADDSIPPTPVAVAPAPAVTQPTERAAEPVVAAPAKAAPVAGASVAASKPLRKPAPPPARAPEARLAVADEPSAPTPVAIPSDEGVREAGTEGIPDLLFARNATWLSPSSRSALDKVVEVLTLDPDRRVVLSGHCDTVGDPEFNRWLSLARARRASRYLREKGIAPTRIEIKSFGAARPAQGEPRSGIQARNRRVEIAVE